MVSCRVLDWRYGHDRILPVDRYSLADYCDLSAGHGKRNSGVDRTRERRTVEADAIEDRLSNSLRNVTDLDVVHGGCDEYRGRCCHGWGKDEFRSVAMDVGCWVHHSIAVQLLATESPRQGLSLTTVLRWEAVSSEIRSNLR